MMIAARSSGIKAVAIWDNMKGDDSGEYWKVAQAVQFNANFVIYPSFSTLFELPILPKSYSVLGNPTLASWQEEIKRVNIQSLKQKLNYDNLIICTYIAGWNGDPQCAAGTTLFAECAKKITKNYLFLLQTHPRSNPENLQHKLFQSIPNVIMTSLNTIEAVAISELVILHKSTAGPKAAAAGKRLLYVVQEQNYSNPLVDCKLVQIVRSPDQFESKVELSLKQTQKEITEGVYKAYKVPRGGKENISAFIEYF